jgi:hypothetical protein
LDGRELARIVNDDFGETVVPPYSNNVPLPFGIDILLEEKVKLSYLIDLINTMD